MLIENIKYCQSSTTNYYFKCHQFINKLFINNESTIADGVAIKYKENLDVYEDLKWQW